MRYLAHPDLFEPPDVGILQSLALVRAARWLGVAPWELAGQSAWWLDVVETAMDVERQQYEQQRRKADGNGR